MCWFPAGLTLITLNHYLLYIIASPSPLHLQHASCDSSDRLRILYMTRRLGSFADMAR
jgi:hypothetical protein